MSPGSPPAPPLPAQLWWLWAAQAAYSITGILVVHARLDARIAAKNPAHAASAHQSLRAALISQLALITLAAATLTQVPWLTAPLLLTVTVHLRGLRQLRTPQALAMPLRQVGRRALALSVVFSVLVTAALW